VQYATVDGEDCVVIASRAAGLSAETNAAL